MAGVVDIGIDYFELFGIDRSFCIDLSDLDSKYFALQKESHPDLVGLDGSISARLNEGYLVLKDIISRAEYLLLLLGYAEVESDVSDLFREGEYLLGLDRLSGEYELEVERLRLEVSRLEGEIGSYLLSDLDDETAGCIWGKVARVKYLRKMVSRGGMNGYSGDRFRHD